MRVPGKKFVAQSLKRVRRRFVPHGLILGYHRISSGVHDPFSLNVSPQNFAEQLDVLKACARPISMSSLLSGPDMLRAWPGSVALTFDDGYRDYLTEALPRMARLEIPSTVFMATGAMGGEFWWDRLARLAVTEVGGDAIAAGLDPMHHARRDRARNGRAPTEALVRCAYADLLNMDRSGRESWLSEIERDASGARGTHPEHQVLSGSEISELAGHQLVDIGCHTVTHPHLATLSTASQRAEIEGSKHYLEDLIDRKVAALSYPNGSRSPETVRIAEQIGFQYACGSHTDVVWGGSHPFDLPRLWAPNCDGDAFSKWLQRWL